MATQYAKYRRPDGDEAILLSDTLSRGRYERKGFEYIGPVDQSPGLEPANVGRDGGMFGSIRNLDATEVVKQATDVVVRKLAGTWTEQEAVDESKLIRGKMAELGSFPIAGLDLPQEEGTSAQAQTGPFPNPVIPQPGSAVSVTGTKADEKTALSGVTTGNVGQTVTDQSGEDGAATDGKRTRDHDGAPDLSKPSSTTRTTSKS